MSTRRILPALLALVIASIAHAQADWPMYGGPDGQWIAPPYDQAVLKDWSKGKLVWKSEVGDIGNGRGGDPRYGVRNGMPEANKIFGGAATPIVYDGKVYMWYFVPRGDAYLKRTVESILKQAKIHPHGDKVNEAYLKKVFAIEAADVMVCIDAKTGKTLWRKEFEKVPFSSSGKPRGWNNAPCAGEGMIFAYGLTGVLRALDAETGQVKWETKEDPEWRKQLDAAIEAGGWAKGSREPVHGPPLMIADGVILSPVGSNGDVTGIDAKTGKKLYAHERMRIRDGVPSIWRHDGKTYFITASRSGTVHCIEAKTGKIAWTLEGKGLCLYTWIGGDFMVINEDGERDDDKNTHLAGYALSPEGAKRLWVLGDEWMSNTGNKAGLIKDGVAYISGRIGSEQKKNRVESRTLLKIDMATGKILRHIGNQSTYRFEKDAYLMWAAGKFIAETDSHHASSRRHITIVPDNLKTTIWNLPIEAANGYGAVINQPFINGKYYVRSSDGHMYCYDVTAK